MSTRWAGSIVGDAAMCFAACFGASGETIAVCTQLCVFLSGTALLLPIAARLQRLGMHDVKARNVFVPFEQRRYIPRSLRNAPVQPPHIIDHVVAMSVEDVRALVS